MTITRSKERIRITGEIFTPLALVDEILSKLPLDTFTDHSKTFIDSSCGDGNFLIRVIAFKIFHGSTAIQALSTTYGVDIMPDNISHARARIITNAYAAFKWKQKNSDLFFHLSPEDERKIGMLKAHDIFARTVNHIVQRNIVCHDALTYDYSFLPIEDQPSTIESIFG